MSDPVNKIEIVAQLSGRLSALAAEAAPELLIGSCAIADGDASALTARELRSLGRSVLSMRRASGAARIIARTLLVRLGAPPGVELPRSQSGAPQWPTGFVGSLAHDDRFAVAAVARRVSLLGIGIDIEPALPLPKDLLETVATPRERALLDGDLLSARLLFCVKEAVFKATHPVDDIFLEHDDVEVCLTSSIARTRSGRNLRFFTIREPCLVAVALLR